jgi:hypothetical protein
MRCRCCPSNNTLPGRGRSYKPASSPPADSVGWSATPSWRSPPLCRHLTDRVSVASCRSTKARSTVRAPAATRCSTNPVSPAGPAWTTEPEIALSSPSYMPGPIACQGFKSYYSLCGHSTICYHRHARGYQDVYLRRLECERIGKASRPHYVEPSIATAALQASSEKIKRAGVFFKIQTSGSHRRLHCRRGWRHEKCSESGCSPGNFVLALACSCLRWLDVARIAQYFT